MCTVTEGGWNGPDFQLNGYAIAYDTVSGRWSDEVPVNSGCGPL